MFQRILKTLRNKIRAREYVVTLHAVEEIEDEGFSVLDVEQAILTGKITKRQRDFDTGEWKYLISGDSVSSDRIVVVTKLSPSKKLVIITVYGKEEQQKR